MLVPLPTDRVPKSYPPYSLVALANYTITVTFCDQLQNVQTDSS